MMVMYYSSIFTLYLDKQDMLRYLKVEHKELIAGFKENVEC